MSAVTLERKSASSSVSSRSTVSSYPSWSTRAKAKKSTGTVAKDKSVAKAKSRATEAAIWKTGFFVSITFVTYLASTLAGHVMAESERQKVLNIGQQVATMNKIERTLAARIDSNESSRDLMAFQSERGFVLDGEAPVVVSPSVGHQFVARR